MSSLDIASREPVQWRAIVFDSVQGIVVLDVTGTTEAEAKGRAHSAAKTHLSCDLIQNVCVMRHTEMPLQWIARKTQWRDTPEPEFYKGIAASTDMRKIEYKG
jgi:hypothetical protein